MILILDSKPNAFFSVNVVARKPEKGSPLQKQILPFLTSFFPNLQFIVTSHSPFVLNSLEDSVVFDLESHERWESGANVGGRDYLRVFRFGPVFAGQQEYDGTV